MYRHELHVTVEICGTEVEVCAEFNISAHSVPDDYWDGGGSGVEIELGPVYATDGTCRDMTETLRGLRDLELKTTRHYPNAGYVNGVWQLGEGVSELAYGYGFTIGRRWDGPRLVPDVVFNQGRTLYDAVEMAVINHVSENERDYEDHDDYDPRDD